MALKLTKNLNYLNFNGVNQQGSTAGLVLENTTFPRKVTFIFRIQSIPTNSQILFLNNGTGMAFGFVGNSIITTHTNQRLRFNTDLIQLNEWNKVVITYNSLINVVLEINGEIAGVLSSSSSWTPQGPNRLNIGYRGNATAFFNGDITYFKIETGGVTSVEYTFTEGSGSTLNDLLHPLTLVNNPTWDSAIVPLNVIGLKIGNKNAFRTFKNEELVFNLYNKLSTNTAPLAIKVGTASTWTFDGGFSPDRTLYAASQWDPSKTDGGGARIYETTNFTEVFSFTTAAYLDTIKFSPDGTKILYSGRTGLFGARNVSDWSLIQPDTLNDARRALEYSAVNTSKNEYLVRSFGGVRVTDIDTLLIKYGILPGGVAWSLAYSRDEKKLAFGTSTGVLNVYDIDGPVPTLIQQVNTGTDRITTVAWGEKDETIAITKLDINDIFVYNTNDWTSSTITVGYNPFDLKYTLDNLYLLVSKNTGSRGIEVRDVQNNYALIQTFNTPSNNTQMLININNNDTMFTLGNQGQRLGFYELNTTSN